MERDVRSLQAAAKRVPKRVEIAKPSLKYYSLKLVCKFSGKQGIVRKESETQKHFGKNAHLRCIFFYRQTDNICEVIRVNEVHKHIVNKTIYDHLPRQRASREKQSVNNIQEAIKLQPNPKLLQQKVEETTGRKATLKDIANIKQRSKHDMNKNNLEDVIQHLKSQPG